MQFNRISRLLDIRHDTLPDAHAGGLYLDARLAELADALRRPPYYQVIQGRSSWLAGIGVEAAMRALGRLGSPSVEPGRLSFTRVQVDSAAAARSNGTTHYSRTNLPLPLHTDGSNMEQPHHVVAFHMIRADQAGGDSLMLPLDRLIEALSPDLAAELRRPIQFGASALPVLWGLDPSIRYYRAQIARSSEQLSDRQHTALDRLDAVLAQPSMADQFRLAQGDVLLINNRRALHGRTGFPPDSQRLMLRYRIHAPWFE